MCKRERKVVIIGGNVELEQRKKEALLLVFIFLRFLMLKSDKRDLVGNNYGQEKGKQQGRSFFLKCCRLKGVLYKLIVRTQG